MEWISVKDRLPTSECLAIGYQQEMIIGYIHKNDENDRNDYGEYICKNESTLLPDVTHWMPLPEPPKAE